MSKSPARIFPHLIIRASAGTGKTYQLSSRYIALLGDNHRSAEILATTFTRKAAGEILDRIVRRLAEAVADPKKREELTAYEAFEQIQRLHPAYRPTPERMFLLLEQLVRDLHRLRIGTLDSFFAQIARCFGLELGLPAGWQIVDEQSDARLRTEAIRRILRQDTPAEVLTLTHLLTKGETKRGVAQLIYDTVDDLYEVFLDTRREAWHAVPRPPKLEVHELETLIERLCVVEMPDKRMQSARGTDAERATAGDWEEFIKKGLAPKAADGSNAYFRKPIPDEAVALYRQLLDHAKAALLWPIAEQTEATWRLLEKFDTVYRSLKYEQRVLRFSDVTRAIALALGNAGHAASDLNRLAFRLDGRIEDILLDEFQDTAPSQWQVLRPLAQYVTDGNPRRSFFCVGDMKQAIYGWRGGVAAIFDAVREMIPDCREESLTRSYRSSPAVIETVNRVFENLDRHSNLDDYLDAVRQWQKMFRTHATARTDLPGYTCLLTARRVDEDDDQKTAILQCAAQRVAMLHQQRPRQSIGVLARENKTVARMVFHLRQLGLRVSQEGGNPLTDSPAVEAILSLLRLADHPGDRVARFHTATGRLGEKLGFSDWRDDRQAVDLAAHWRRIIQQEGYGPTVEHLTRLLADFCDRRQWGRLGRLIDLAYGYDRRSSSRVIDFVRTVESEKIVDPSTDDIRVMTIHQAKGLEFDSVVLVDLERFILGQSPPVVVERPNPVGPITRVCRSINKDLLPLVPESLARMFEAEQTERIIGSLCVLYVAMTRAVHSLHLIAAPTKENERTLPKTIIGLLRAALLGGKPLEPEQTAFELGDARWYEKLPAIEPAAEAGPSPEEPETIEVRFAAPRERRRRGIQRRTPSSLEGGRFVSLDRALVSAGEPTESQKQGTIIHAWCEQLRWSDRLPLAPEQMQQAADRALGYRCDIGPAAQRWQQMLAQPAIAALLEPSTYTPALLASLLPSLPAPSGPLRLEVDCELPFSIFDGGVLLTGSIDRLVRIYDGDRLAAIDLIDFKTDRVPGDAAALAERIEYYRPQLQAYRRAAAKLWHLPPTAIAARLAFLQLGRVETI